MAVIANVDQALQNLMQGGKSGPVTDRALKLSLAALLKQMKATQKIDLKASPTGRQTAEQGKAYIEIANLVSQLKRQMEAGADTAVIKALVSIDKTLGEISASAAKARNKDSKDLLDGFRMEVESMMKKAATPASSARQKIKERITSAKSGVPSSNKNSTESSAKPPPRAPGSTAGSAAPRSTMIGAIGSMLGKASKSNKSEANRVHDELAKLFGSAKVTQKFLEQLNKKFEPGQARKQLKEKGYSEVEANRYVTQMEKSANVFNKSSEQLSTLTEKFLEKGKFTDHEAERLVSLVEGMQKTLANLPRDFDVELNMGELLEQQKEMLQMDIPKEAKMKMLKEISQYQLENNKLNAANRSQLKAIVEHDDLDEKQMARAITLLDDLSQKQTKANLSIDDLNATMDASVATADEIKATLEGRTTLGKSMKEAFLKNAGTVSAGASHGASSITEGLLAGLGGPLGIFADRLFGISDKMGAVTEAMTDKASEAIGGWMKDKTGDFTDKMSSIFGGGKGKGIMSIFGANKTEKPVVADPAQLKTDEETLQAVEEGNKDNRKDNKETQKLLAGIRKDLQTPGTMTGAQDAMARVKGAAKAKADKKKAGAAALAAAGAGGKEGEGGGGGLGIVGDIAGGAAATWAGKKLAGTKIGQSVLTKGGGFLAKYGKYLPGKLGTMAKAATLVGGGAAVASGASHLAGAAPAAAGLAGAAGGATTGLSAAATGGSTLAKIGTAATGEVGKTAAKGMLGKVPVIGALIGGGLTYASDISEGKSQKEAIAAGVGNAGGGLAGAAGGAAMGAAIGSVVPVLGTAVGGLIGGIVGGIGGSMGGEAIGRGLFGGDGDKEKAEEANKKLAEQNGVNPTIAGASGAPIQASAVSGAYDPLAANTAATQANTAAITERGSEKVGEEDDDTKIPAWAKWLGGSILGLAAFRYGGAAIGKLAGKVAGSAGSAGSAAGSAVEGATSAAGTVAKTATSGAGAAAKAAPSVAPAMDAAKVATAGAGSKLGTAAKIAAGVGLGGASLGALSAQFESGKKGSDAVGWDSTGGTSYGKYQIASKTGTMDKFLKFADKNNPEVAARLRAAGPADGGKNGAFAQEWKNLSKEGKLGDMEHQFIKESHFDKGMAGLKNEGLKDMIAKSPALQDAMWSTSVQHGGGNGKGTSGASGIFNKVYKEGMSAEDLTKAVYAERGTKFGSSSAGVQQSVQNRFFGKGGEQDKVLAALAAEKNGTAPKGVAPGSGLPADINPETGKPRATPDVNKVITPTATDYEPTLGQSKQPIASSMSGIPAPTGGWSKEQIDAYHNRVNTAQTKAGNSGIGIAAGTIAGAGGAAGGAKLGSKFGWKGALVGGAIGGVAGWMGGSAVGNNVDRKVNGDAEAKALDKQQSALAAKIEASKDPAEQAQLREQMHQLQQQQTGKQFEVSMASASEAMLKGGGYTYNPGATAASGRSAELDALKAKYGSGRNAGVAAASNTGAGAVTPIPQPPSIVPVGESLSSGESLVTDKPYDPASAFPGRKKANFSANTGEPVGGSVNGVGNTISSGKLPGINQVANGLPGASLPNVPWDPASAFPGRKKANFSANTGEPKGGASDKPYDPASAFPGRKKANFSANTGEPKGGAASAVPQPGSVLQSVSEKPYDPASAFPGRKKADFSANTGEPKGGSSDVPWDPASAFPGRKKADFSANTGEMKPYQDVPAVNPQTSVTAASQNVSSQFQPPLERSGVSNGSVSNANTQSQGGSTSQGNASAGAAPIHIDNLGLIMLNSGIL